MLPVPGDEGVAGEIEPLLEASHWRFAARVLEAAHFAANSDGLYPVYITSFRCAPDSFTIEYFKRILDAKGKPYLILQLDEHDSNVGYETRIEAGVRSFRNHFASISIPNEPPVVLASKGNLPVNPGLEIDLTGKTLLFPNWESITSPLLVANLQAAGIDARLLEEDETTVLESMRMNTGQCIPLNAMVLESIRYVDRHHLDPGRTVLWIGKSTCSCNIGMYPYYIKSLFETHGKGMEKQGVYIGDISHIEISPLVAIHTYLAYLFGGLIRKLGCQIRPYEVEKGETDKATAAAIEIFKQAFRNRQNLSYIEAIEEALALFSRIRFVKTARPKVAIFGDLYMRDNVIMNQDLIHDIENAEGEVLTTPYNEYLKIISSAQFKKWFKQGEIFKLLIFRPLLSVVEFLEKKYFAHFKRLIQDPLVSGNDEYHEIFSRFNMRLEQGGESWDNILKIFHILKVHPDISLFVQTNPAFCCPALITEAQGRDIERITGVPVVTLTYDGTGTPINDRIIPYLRYPRRIN